MSDFTEPQRLNSKDSANNLKEDYVTQLQIIPSPEEFSKSIIGSKVMAILHDWANFNLWWSGIGNGLLKMGLPSLVFSDTHIFEPYICSLVWSL